MDSTTRGSLISLSMRYFNRAQTEYAICSRGWCIVVRRGWK